MLEIRGIWLCHMSRWDRYVLRPRIWVETPRSGTVPHIGPYRFATGLTKKYSCNPRPTLAKFLKTKNHTAPNSYVTSIFCMYIRFSNFVRSIKKLYYMFKKCSVSIIKYSSYNIKINEY